jgi:hypothetical protein
MALSSKIATQVDGGVKARGRHYYSSGSVRILHGDRESVAASVQGTSLYQVQLARAKSTLKVFCDCPYFEDHGTCKHIWATILTAEKLGYLQGDGPLLFIEDEPPTEEDVSWRDNEDGEWDPPFEVDYRPAQHSSPFRLAAPRKPSPAKMSWKQELTRLRAQIEPAQTPYNPWPAGREVVYLVDVPASQVNHQLVIELAARDRKNNGEWGKPRSQPLPHDQIARLPSPADRQILGLLLGAREQDPHSWSTYSYDSYSPPVPRRYRLGPAIQDALLPEICSTGRCWIRHAKLEVEEAPLVWSEGEPWELWLKVEATGKGSYQLDGELRRATENLALNAPLLLLPGGLVFQNERVSRFNDFGAFDWIKLFKRGGPIQVPAKQVNGFLEELLGMSQLPKLDLPPELRFEEVSLTPRPRLLVKAQERNGWQRRNRLEGELSFDYDGTILAPGQGGRCFCQMEPRRLVTRDLAAETAAAERLRLLGWRPAPYHRGPTLETAPRNLPRITRTLLDEGWHVEAEGKLYRQAGAFHIDVTSGIDWFDLNGSVEFGDQTARLPALLAALRRGEGVVQLDDGTFGMLPEEWLKKYGVLAGLGKEEEDGALRFSRCQVGLLDALLATQPEATCDAVFAQARDELRRFEGIQASDPPAGFVGELRGYQREGLGWLHFLPKFGFGGCLADDMGLGKTVQVLALLEARRALRAQSPKTGPGPSLVVVPKSLVFNWKQEAARFAPRLRILDHTGAGRARENVSFDEVDLVITTYGTLRRDALQFKDLEFDYCILDEAQAIKNANTESAKAVRLLRASHRLVLSGTPIENHLGELWSLFEFLNPGMLGAASVFRMNGGGLRNPDDSTRHLLGRALRPFILRRTKNEVAKDLPEKTEQTIFCELEPEQRKLYDELRAHYRQSLLARVDKDGLKKSKVQVLEALLRLRQAACHPGLIDKERTEEPSAKLETLLGQLTEVLEEGHKALVFSQFTSLLAIVRDRLDKAGIPYEYLDGRTRDRAGRVERFQQDPDCKLFLISLKAGGVGLNLTAAEYVFLLDPWWNPAVEAQAIDRTHRIGQTEKVFAYRLIARDTVEEKVLELQGTKRALADAILNADNSLLRDLGREDLELLLS